VPKSSTSYWDDKLEAYVVNTRDLPFFVCLLSAIVMGYFMIVNTYELMRSKVDVLIHYYNLHVPRRTFP
jgi:hypothetical protein